MARFEAAVRSPIAFRRSVGRLSTECLKQPPETVGIKFEGRLFVWHVFEPRDDPIFGHEEDGPSVTTVLEDESDESAVATDLQRFLSALAFHHDQPAEAVSYGGSGETDPYHPAIWRERRTHAVWTISEPYSEISLRPEKNVRLAIAYFREGLNADSPFYRFLAFWNSLDVVFDAESDSPARDSFLNSAAPRFAAAWNDHYLFPKNLAKALRDDSRHAIAHVLRRRGKTTIDPDEAYDRMRLDMESTLLHTLAGAAIREKYPYAVVTNDH